MVKYKDILRNALEKDVGIRPNKKSRKIAGFHILQEK
jgi:hypothetical protein